jgi:hypothetical protein
MFSKAAREIDDIVTGLQKKYDLIREDAMAQMILSLGHHADLHGIDFLELVKFGVRHWHVERTKGYDTLKCCDVSIDIGELY